MRVVNYVHNGWPNYKQLQTTDEKVYFKLRDSLCFEDDLLFINHKVVVPLSLRQNMLNIIHKSHFGVVKCKSRARDVMFWPNMSKEIEKLVLSCKICEKFRHKNGKEPMLSHPSPTRPWERISSDILEFGGYSYLVVIDSYSNWLELHKIPDKSAHSVKSVLKKLFSSYGAPDYFLSDNVPYNSKLFKDFAKEWHFEAITSSPYYPKGNGLAEKGVSIAKSLLKKSVITNVDIDILLFDYRNTPLTQIKLSPAQLFLNRVLKSKLPVTVKQLEPKVTKRV